MGFGQIIIFLHSNNQSNLYWQRMPTEWITCSIYPSFFSSSTHTQWLGCIRCKKSAMSFCSPSPQLFIYRIRIYGQRKFDSVWVGGWWFAIACERTLRDDWFIWGGASGFRSRMKSAKGCLSVWIYCSLNNFFKYLFSGLVPEQESQVQEAWEPNAQRWVWFYW